MVDLLQLNKLKMLHHYLKYCKSIDLLGPAFLLNLTCMAIFRHHRPDERYFSKNPYKIIFLENGILSALLIATCIPCFLVLIKPFFSRYIPNMFKRMGLNIVMLNIFIFAIYNSLQH